jgi:hypothetical protein
VQSKIEPLDGIATFDEKVIRTLESVGEGLGGVWIVLFSSSLGSSLTETFLGLGGACPHCATATSLLRHMSANLRAVARVGRVDCRKAQQVCRQQLEEDAQAQWLARKKTDGRNNADADMEWKADDQGFKDVRIQQMLPHFRIYIGKDVPQPLKPQKQKRDGEDERGEEGEEGEEGGADGQGGGTRKKKVESRSMIPRAFESEAEMHQGLLVMEKVVRLTSADRVDTKGAVQTRPGEDDEEPEDGDEASGAGGGGGGFEYDPPPMPQQQQFVVHQQLPPGAERGQIGN